MEIDIKSCVLSDGVDEYAINKFLCQVFTDGVNSCGKLCSLVKESASRKFDMKEEVLCSLYCCINFPNVIQFTNRKILIYDQNY